MKFQEEDLEFDFDDDKWDPVLAYDKTPDYEKMKKVIDGTKGVDFLGLYKKSDLYFIEVKDYRGFRI